jgi:hypothetical protein
MLELIVKTLFLWIIATSSVYAQQPHLVTPQGTVHNPSSGQLDKDVSGTQAIISGSAEGTVHGSEEPTDKSPVKPAAPGGPTRRVLPVRNESDRGRTPILRDELAVVVLASTYPSEQIPAEKPGTTTAATEAASSEQKLSSLSRDQFRRALPHLKRAEALFANDIFETALAEYKNAYEILAGHPKQYQVLYNIALCYERLNLYSEALACYQQYLRICSAYGKECTAVEKDIRTLQAILAKLHISVDVEAEMWVDGVLMGTAPGTVMLAGGRHTVALRAPGYESEQVEVHIPAGTVQELNITMIKNGISSTFFWGSTVLAMGAMGIGAYYGTEAVMKRNEADRNNGMLVTNKTGKQIDALSLKADLCFGIGGAFAITSVILFFITDWRTEAKPTASSLQSKPHLKLSAYLDPFKNCAVLSGAF